MFGYWATGSRAMETRPMMTVMMAMTIATIGRLTKNCGMVGLGFARQAGVAAGAGNANGVAAGDGVVPGTTGVSGAGAPSSAASGGLIM